MDNSPGIRINPLKSCDLSHLAIDGDVPWSPYGRYLSARPSFTLDPLFHAGAYYVQDTSAMFTGWMFRRVLTLSGGRRVLDLCAAPGGKTTDIAASLREKYGNAFFLTSNEVIRQRAAVLADNAALWGDPNVAVTSSDPSAFAALKGFFDIMVADVPCSGEGMFRKNENAVKMWSDDNVSLCAARQKRIVADAWDTLAPGGTLIYSTCTFNDRENDDNVEWIAETLGGEIIEFPLEFDGPVRTRHGFLLHPDNVRGDGQYCAAIRKAGNTEPRRGEESPSPGGGAGFYEKNGEIYAVPEFAAACAGLAGRRLKILSAGTHAFTVKGKDRIPCADLALSAMLDPDDFPCVELSRENALHFLHKDSLTLQDVPEGYILVKYGGLPLGFVKNLGRRANNLHPASRRILMDIV